MLIKTYATVLIDTQCWMQENLNVGTMITGATNMTDNSILEKYCYSNSEANCNIHGGLYQWDEAMQYVTTLGAQGLCPTGWHIPTHDQFTTLERFLCTSLGNTSCETKFPYDTTTGDWRGTNEGAEMKSASGLWKALQSGYRATNGTFASINTGDSFWSSFEYDASNAWRRGLGNSSTHTVFRGANLKTFGWPVRCLKN